MCTSRRPRAPTLPPVVFIHGASANLNDQMVPLRPLLEGRAEMLFLDRPGHGWSGRGPGNNEDAVGAGRTIAALMDRLGIGQAIIVGHSFGGSIAAAFALDHPEKTKGLVFLSAATHPWPGGSDVLVLSSDRDAGARLAVFRDRRQSGRHACRIGRGDDLRLRAERGARELSDARVRFRWC